jgi:NAD+ kinase
MPDTVPILQHIVIATHPKFPQAAPKAGEIDAFLKEQGINTVLGLLDDEEMTRLIKTGQFDMMIALGGDGTMLRAGHLCGPSKLPILGINLGRFGFLTEINYDSWRDNLPGLLQGEYWIEERMMLYAEQSRAGEPIGKWEVVNEVVVGRGKIVRPVHLVAEVDGRFLTTYVADALIASTPTGSTAYALAAGGPILPPELRTILLVPVAPHLSIDRAIVLAEGSSVSIRVQTDHEAILCVDGQVPVGLADGDKVNVRTSDHTVRFVRFQDPGYFYRNLTPHMSQNPSAGNHR